MAIGHENVARIIQELSWPGFNHTHAYDDWRWLDEPDTLEDRALRRLRAGRLGTEAKGVHTYLREGNGATFFDRHGRLPNLFRVYQPASCTYSRTWCPSTIKKVVIRKRRLFRPAEEAYRMVCIRCDKVLGIPVGIDLPDPDKQGALSVAVTEGGGLSVIGESK